VLSLNDTPEVRSFTIRDVQLSYSARNHSGRRHAEVFITNFEHYAKDCLQANIPQAAGEPGLSELLLFILLFAHRPVVTDFVVAPWKLKP
jgi:hypothetical protein